METESAIFNVPAMLIEQLRCHLFNLFGPENLTLAIVDAERQLKTNHPSRIGPLMENNSRLLNQLCDRLDDGEEPLIAKIPGGCAAGCTLIADCGFLGYLIVVLEHYTPETAGANLALIEMVFAQSQLICDLLERQNRLAHKNILSAVGAR